MKSEQMEQYNATSLSFFSLVKGQDQHTAKAKTTLKYY